MGLILRRLLGSLLLPLLLLALLLLAANTWPGRRLVAWGLTTSSGGQLVIEGLGGTLPFAPRAQRIELGDATGAWLRIEDTALAIDARRLLHGELAIESLEARSVVIERVPARDQDNSGPIALPLPVLLRHVAVEELSVERVLPGAPRLNISGDAGLDAPGEAHLRLLVSAPGRDDQYRLEGGVGGGRYRLVVALREEPGGLSSALAQSSGLPPRVGLGTWTLRAGLEGPPEAITVAAMLDAGPLRAAADGLVDLQTRSAAHLRLSAGLDAMAPGSGAIPALAWRRIGIGAELEGPLSSPQGSARLEADGLSYGAMALEHLLANAAGDARRLRLGAELRGPRAPLELPELGIAAPLQIAAELRPEGPGLPFEIGISHPLIDLAGAGTLSDRTGYGTLSLSSLGPLAPWIGRNLAGSADLDFRGSAGDRPRLEASGDLWLTQAPGPLAELFGPAARLALSARRDGGAWQIQSARLEADRIEAAAQGQIGSDRLDLGWSLELADLTAFGPGWSGRIDARGGISGPLRAPDLVADLAASAGPDRIAGRLSASLAEPRAALELTGTWAAQPVAVDLAAGRSPEGDVGLSLGDSHWASLAAAGGLTLEAGAALPRGELRLSAGNLADVGPLLVTLWPAGPAGAGARSGAGVVGGRLDARLTLSDSGSLSVAAEGEGLALPGAIGIRAITLDALVSDPLTGADTDAIVQLSGLSLERISGDLALGARGPAAALELTAETALATPAGPLKLDAGGRLDVPARRLELRRLKGQVGGEGLRLLEPAVLGLADGLGVDRLRLGLGVGTIEVAGRLTPVLDLDATATRLPLDLVQLVAPDLPLSGMLGAQIRLIGPLNAPAGSIRARASALRLREGAWRSLPPARFEVSATLRPTATEIDARAEIGSGASLNVRGRVDGTLLAPTALALRTDGLLDLALLDPLLTGRGSQARGQARLDAAVSGTPTAPRMDGRLTLADGSLWDRTLGLALNDIDGTLRLAGDTVRVERLTARAGRGALALEGSIGALAPGLPVDLRLVARDAQPLQLDLLDVAGDAEIRLQGRAAETLGATGSLRLSRVEIRLPERLPATVATLEVSERGRRDHPRRAQATARTPLLGPDLRIDLTVSAPRAVFVRGRGIDAELGGEVRLRGTLGEPLVSGGFNLLRGEYELVGQALRFSRGRLGFDGAAGLDPTLDLEARVTAAGSTAVLAVLGSASAPRIVLRGEPELPEDEVLSRLLFGVAGGRLSGLQAVRLGMAAAALAGIEAGGEGLRVLDEARSGLGLERLTIGTDQRGAMTIEAGRQIRERVYLGARQGTRAGETQGVLRIEVSPRVRLEADVGASGGTRGGGAFEKEY